MFNNFSRTVVGLSSAIEMIEDVIAIEIETEIETVVIETEESTVTEIENIGDLIGILKSKNIHMSMKVV